jgi:hypothetical protein
VNYHTIMTNQKTSLPLSHEKYLPSNTRCIILLYTSKYPGICYAILINYLIICFKTYASIKKILININKKIGSVAGNRRPRARASLQSVISTCVRLLLRLGGFPDEAADSHITNWKDPPFLTGKSSISIRAMFNSYLEFLC